MHAQPSWVSSYKGTGAEWNGFRAEHAPHARSRASHWPGTARSRHQNQKQWDSRRRQQQPFHASAQPFAERVKKIHVPKRRDGRRPDAGQRQHQHNAQRRHRQWQRSSFGHYESTQAKRGPVQMKLPCVMIPAALSSVLRAPPYFDSGTMAKDSRVKMQRGFDKYASSQYRKGTGMRLSEERAAVKGDFTWASVASSSKSERSTASQWPEYPSLEAYSYRRVEQKTDRFCHFYEKPMTGKTLQRATETRQQWVYFEPAKGKRSLAVCSTHSRDGIASELTAASGIQKPVVSVVSESCAARVRSQATGCAQMRVQFPEHYAADVVLSDAVNDKIKEEGNGAFDRSAVQQSACVQPNEGRVAAEHINEHSHIGTVVSDDADVGYCKKKKVDYGDDASDVVHAADEKSETGAGDDEHICDVTDFDADILVLSDLELDSEVEEDKDEEDVVTVKPKVLVEGGRHHVEGGSHHVEGGSHHVEGGRHHHVEDGRRHQVEGGRRHQVEDGDCKQQSFAGESEEKTIGCLCDIFGGGIGDALPDTAELVLACKRQQVLNHYQTRCKQWVEILQRDVRTNNAQLMELWRNELKQAIADCQIDSSKLALEIWKALAMFKRWLNDAHRSGLYFAGFFETQIVFALARVHVDWHSEELRSAVRLTDWLCVLREIALVIENELARFKRKRKELIAWFVQSARQFLSLAAANSLTINGQGKDGKN